MQVGIDREVIKYLAEKSYDPLQGARLIRRRIQEMVEDPLAEKIINGEIIPPSEARISIENNAIQIRQIDLARA
jgi:ATP-dependent Clp protease ATP-binding subunit ClpB